MTHASVRIVTQLLTHLLVVGVFLFTLYCGIVICKASIPWTPARAVSFRADLNLDPSLAKNNKAGKKKQRKIYKEWLQAQGGNFPDDAQLLRLGGLLWKGELTPRRDAQLQVCLRFWAQQSS